MYEELRGLAQEMNLVLVTADQTNRSGLNQEVVTLDSIAESYAKATVCDVIMTISRTMDDKATKTGRLFVAQSRLGDDGVVFPFLMDPAKVRVDIVNESQTAGLAILEGQELTKESMLSRLSELKNNKERES